ncbi:hypothetical protein ACFQFR_06005 [Streptomyces goshikiensis]
MNQILDAVRAGRTSLLPLLIKRLTLPERRALLPELTALRKEVRDWDWARRREHGGVASALLVAGAGCHTGAAAAAAWIGSRDLAEGARPGAAPGGPACSPCSATASPPGWATSPTASPPAPSPSRTTTR